MSVTQNTRKFLLKLHVNYSLRLQSILIIISINWTISIPGNIVSG